MQRSEIEKQSSTTPDQGYQWESYKLTVITASERSIKYFTEGLKLVS